MSSTPDPDNAALQTAMLTRADLSKRWKISIPTLRRWEKKHANFPKPLRFGSRLLRYLMSDILAFESQRRLN